MFIVVSIVDCVRVLGQWGGGVGGDFRVPMADLNAFEAANSSSVGPVGSGCFCLRVVRFLVGPSSCLRRVFRVLEAMLSWIGPSRTRVE